MIPYGAESVRCVNCGVSATARRAVRVNVEVVYDDGTFEELALDKPQVTGVYRQLSTTARSMNDYRSFYVEGDLVA